MPEQKSSTLLTQDENDSVFHLLGYKCQTMSTTVVELYTTAGPSNDEWLYKETGVLCLVKDSNKRSYFFRLYCPERRKLLWEHEIYNDIQYLATTSFLHTFEAENCIAGFNFASEDEGKVMRKTLLETLEFKKQKRVERRNRYNSNISKDTQEVNGGPTLMNINVNSGVQNSHKPTGRKKKINKCDIGEPQDFRHVSHVGWDPHKGFDLNKADDPHLKEFFNQAGVSENHLKDRETREFIYDFIQKNGGIAAVKEQVEPAPPIPLRNKIAPPRPPSVSVSSVRTLGPPPPPPRIQPPRSIPIVSGAPRQEVVCAEASYPPPPPPPPPPGPPPPPVMNALHITEPPSSAPEPALEGTAALMQELTSNRKQLKPLNLDKENDERRLPPMATDSHVQLMDQIKEGIKLKPVIQVPADSQTVPSSDLASALAKALAERSKVIHSDSSSTTDTDEPDDEWDD